MPASAEHLSSSSFPEHPHTFSFKRHENFVTICDKSGEDHRDGNMAQFGQNEETFKPCEVPRKRNICPFNI